MGERRAHRGPAPRSDRQILAHPEDMALIALVAAGQVSRESGRVNAPYVVNADPLRMDLRRLAREELVHAPIAGPPTLQPRGARLLQVMRGELPQPSDEG